MNSVACADPSRSQIDPDERLERRNCFFLIAKLLVVTQLVIEQRHQVVEQRQKIHFAHFIPGNRRFERERRLRDDRCAIELEEPLRRRHGQIAILDAEEEQRRRVLQPLSLGAR